MIKDLKFETSDFTGNDIESLPDRPGDSGITTAELKRRFDQIPKAMLALGAFNSLVDELTGADGAENIGMKSGKNVQTAFGELEQATAEATRAANTAAEQGRAAQAAAGNATEAAEEATKKASDAEAAAQTAAGQGAEAAAAAQLATSAVLEVKQYSEEKAQEAKDYVDNAILESGAVTSVFGRAGAITAQKGDYTADMVGARPDTWTPTAEDTGAIPNAEKGAANGVATLDGSGKVPSSQLPSMDYIPTTQKGAAGGVASLDASGKIPTSQLPTRVVEITLTAAGWSGESPYAQAVNISNVTANSKVDLQPSGDVLSAMMESGVIALYVENDGGTLTAYALGAAPSVDVTMQATVTEVAR